VLQLLSLLAEYPAAYPMRPTSPHPLHVQQYPQSSNPIPIAFYESKYGNTCGKNEVATKI
jgi:hypothetical protein